MFDLEQAISERRSTRMFLPDNAVPRALVHEPLELAIRAPSNSNIQPWRVVLVSGPARDRPGGGHVGRGAKQAAEGPAPARTFRAPSP
jgi:nitroreductase